jgi:hypothetical protein
MLNREPGNPLATSQRLALLHWADESGRQRHSAADSFTMP